MNILYVVQIELNPLSMDLFNSHLLHTLLNLFQWDIEHARDVECGDRFEIAFGTLLAYEVRDALFKCIVICRA